MFTIQKLNSLPSKTRLRKIIQILQKMEIDISLNSIPEFSYLKAILHTLIIDKKINKQTIDILKKAKIDEYFSQPSQLLRQINHIRHVLLNHLQIPAVEWDMLDLHTGKLDPSLRTVFPVAVYIEEVRSPYNIGSIFRTAEAFGVQRIYLSPGTPLPHHKHAHKTARGCEEIIPWSVKPLNFLKKQKTVFTLELGGCSLDEYVFPASGIVILGSEELGVSPQALAIAHKKAGTVSIPMGGVKRSLNVSVAFGILMQKWFNTLIRQRGT
jgi:TrmH family RNA methyltransferase